MIVHRVSGNEYKDDLSGGGGLKSEGRWHNRGIPIIYTSESKAVAKKEKQRGPAGKIIPDGFVYVSYEIPDNIEILEITREMLDDIPWDKTPYKGGPTQIIGSDLLAQGEFAVIKVPSVVDDKSYNFIINPNHPDARRITIKDSRTKVE
ncbi:RES family NAD+ phosphorylase [Pricia sp.]|uniref:RES family NAD+ phosphorylase n=1 Tax=Pricia sp. TaxID=2268138 RepID=UPI0035947F91